MLITRAWHIGDVILGAASLKRDRSVLNISRVAFALIGLGGNFILARRNNQ